MLLQLFAIENAVKKRVFANFFCFSQIIRTIYFILQEFFCFLSAKRLFC